ncbi:MAG: diguanylate cyclase (GGDEF)-like protein [Methylophagaceae bacterium]|jgi:diguanylate cyclase (GGDEF)-like protein
MTHENYRLATIQYLALVSIFVLLPLVFYHLWGGSYNLAIPLAIVISGLAGLFYGCYKNKIKFENVQWVVIPSLTIIVFYAVQALGFKALLWVYPSIVVFFITIPLKNALIYNLIFIVIFTLIGRDLAEPELIIRFFVTSLSVYGLVAIFVTVIQRQQEAMRNAAVTDTLTGLLNRSTLYNSLAEAISQNVRAHIPMTLIAVDLDLFKNVNDKFGHDAGDEVLRNTSKILSNGSRSTDKFFRLGGEEFLILLFNTSGKEGIMKAEHIREQFLVYGGHMPSASFGVAEYLKGESVEHWLKRSDINLYKAKESGRNKVISDLTDN